MARTNNKGGNSAKMKGFKAHSGGTTPMKFLGGIGKAIGGAASKLFGGGGGGAPGAPGAAGMAAGMGAGGGGLGAMFGGVGGPIGHFQQQKALAQNFSPMPKRKSKTIRPTSVKFLGDMVDGPSPMRSTSHDMQLIQGAKDVATGYGSTKYANIAGAKAWEDITNTVEETVNRGSKAMIAKDRRRQKREDKSFKKYGKWHDKRDWSDSKAHMITDDHGLRYKKKYKW